MTQEAIRYNSLHQEKIVTETENFANPLTAIIAKASDVDKKYYGQTFLIL